MSERSVFLRHLIGGGWATDFGGRAQAQIQNSIVTIPFLTTADNIIYKMDGSVAKPGGTAKINGTVFQSGATIKGIYDYWRTGAAGTPAQHRIVHVDTVVKKDDGDETFTDLFTGLQAGKMPDYTTCEDLLILTSNSTTDVPKSWDGTTAQSLAGSPPNFSFAVVYKGRLFASGNASAPSKVYYTGRFDPTNWSGQGSGDFNINPNDGDVVTGLAVYKDRLWIFKGPNKGSIHYISGAAPTGDDPFRETVFITGVGSVNHQTITTFGDDLCFMWSDGSVHSLKNLESEGLFGARSLTFPIQSWIRANLKISSLSQAVATTLPGDGMVLYGLPLSGSTTNNMIIGFDYRFSPIRWFQWSTFGTMGTAMTTMMDPDDANRRKLVLGGADGYIRHALTTRKTLDTGTNIGQNIVTPFLDYGVPQNFKTITGGSIGVKTIGNASAIFKWQRDNFAYQSHSVTLLSGTAELAPSVGGTNFILNTHTLGGDSFVDKFFDLEEGGEFRSIRYQILNAAANDSVDLDDFGALVEGGGFSIE